MIYSFTRITLHPTSHFSPYAAVFSEISQRFFILLSENELRDNTKAQILPLHAYIVTE